MEWNYLIIVLFSILATLVGVGIYNNVRKNKEFNIHLLTPIIIDGITEAEKIYDAAQVGKEAVLSYIVNYTVTAIQGSDVFTQVEKDFLSGERIKSIIEPLVDKLWDKKV